MMLSFFVSETVQIFPFLEKFMSNLYARGVAMLCRAPVADFAAPVGVNPFMLPFYTIIF